MKKVKRKFLARNENHYNKVFHNVHAAYLGETILEKVKYKRTKLKNQDKKN